MGNILPKKPLWAGGEGKPFVDWLAMELVPNQMTFLMSPLSIGDCHIVQEGMTPWRP